MDTHDAYQPNLPTRYNAARAVSLAGGDISADAPRPISARVILRGLSRYWWQVALVWVVSSISLAAVVYLKIQPSFESSSTLEVLPGRQNLFGVAMADGSASSLETQVKMMTSTSVLSAALQNPKLQELGRIRSALDPIADLRRNLRVMAVPGTLLFQVAMSSPSPIEAATIVNAVVDAYLKITIDRTEGTTFRQIKELETYQVELDRKLGEKNNELMDLVKNSDVDPQAVAIAPAAAEGSGAAAANNGNRMAMNMPMSEYMVARNRLVQMNLDLFEAKALLDRRQAEAAASPTGRMNDQDKLNRRVNDALMTDPGLTNIYSNLAQLQSRYDKAEAVTRNHLDPTLRDLQKRIVAAEKDLRQMKEQKEDEYRRRFAAEPTSPTGNRPLEEATERYNILAATKATLEKQLSQYAVASKKGAGDQVRIQFIREDRSLTMMLQQEVHKRLEQLRYEARGQDRVQRIDKAFASNLASSDGRMKMMAMIPLGLLAGLLGLVILLEIRAGRIAHPDDISARVKAEVFSVPPLPSSAPQSQTSLARGRMSAVEEFTQRVDHLRVALCGEGIDPIGRCVMITSAAGGEGKTTLSAQLASRCANAGASTLLIDADLRRATLGRLLEVPEGAGLAEVLAGEADPEAAMVVIGAAGGFHFLPAGGGNHDPSRVLRGPRIGDLLERLRSSFDVIIIDTPPVLPVPDALTLGRWVDGAVLAVRRDASRFSLVERANRMLSASGIPILGVVVNGVPSHEAGYGGGYASVAYGGGGNYTQGGGAYGGLPDEELPNAAS